MALSGILEIVLVIAVVGVIVWLITTYLPMPPIFRTIIYIVVAIAFLIWLISLVSGAGAHHGTVLHLLAL